MITQKQAETLEREHTILAIMQHAETLGIEARYTDITELAVWLHRQEATLHRIAENHCNGHPRQVTERRDGKVYQYGVEDQEWLARDEKTEARIQNQVRARLADYKIPVTFQGDPRGGAIRMKLGWSNNLGGEDLTIGW
jgi:hypothetical protein